MACRISRRLFSPVSLGILLLCLVCLAEMHRSHSVTKNGSAGGARRVASVAVFPRIQRRATVSPSCGVAMRISHFKSTALELRDSQRVIRQISMFICILRLIKKWRAAPPNRHHVASKGSGLIVLMAFKVKLNYAQRERD